VPPLPPAATPPRRPELWGTAFGDNSSNPLLPGDGAADAESEVDPARTMRRMIGGLRARDAAAWCMATAGAGGFIARLPETHGVPDWISQEEIDHYVRGVHQDRFHRRAEMVRHFDRKGSDGDDAGADDRGDDGYRGTDDPCWLTPRARRGRRRSARTARLIDRRRGPPLGAAGAAGERFNAAPVECLDGVEQK